MRPPPAPLADCGLVRPVSSNNWAEDDDVEVVPWDSTIRALDEPRADAEELFAKTGGGTEA